MNRSTGYSTLKWLTNDRNVSAYYIVKRKNGSGGHNRAFTPRCISKLNKMVHGKTGLSQRKIGKTFRVSQQGVSSVVKRVGLHYLKRSVIPKVIKAQVMKQKSRLSKLRRGIFKPSSPVVIVMDDKCYFSLSGESMVTNLGYYTDGSNPVARNVQCRGKQKFPPRVLLWCAISSRGISKPFLHESGTFTNVLYQHIIKSHLFPCLLYTSPSPRD